MMVPGQVDDLFVEETLDLFLCFRVVRRGEDMEDLFPGGSQVWWVFLWGGCLY